MLNPHLKVLSTENIVVIDFETYYDSDYTLSGYKGLNVSEYVRDPRFLAHGMAIKIGSQPAKWVSGAQIDTVLRSMDWTKYGVVAHNTQFDGFILSQVYNIVPAVWLDTLAMARGTLGHAIRHTLDSTSQALGIGSKIKGALESTKGKTTLTSEEEARLAEYSILDAELCSQVFWKLYPNLTDEELELIHKTTRMFCEPVLETDKALLKNLIDSEINKKQKFLEEINLEREDLLSADKFAEALRSAGLSEEELPVKISPTTGHNIYAFAKTDEGFKKLLNHANADIRKLASARLAIKSTIHETRAGRILSSSNEAALPVALNYCGAHTTRWSGGNKLNLQNLPKGSGLRRAIRAPRGQVLVVADSAQIEARITAWLAGEKDLVDAFAKGQDVYKIMAAKLYNKDIEDITKDERFIGKTCVLGLGFGMGGAKLVSTLASGSQGPPVYISEEVAQKYVHVYRSTYPSIPILWKSMDTVLEHMRAGITGDIRGLSSLKYGHQWVKLPNQLFLQYPGLDYAGNLDVGSDFHRPDQLLYRTTSGYSKIYGGLLTENIVQALARVYIGECMIRVDSKYKVVTMTHDEIVALAPKQEADEALNFMTEVMASPPSWAPDLPVKAEGGYDECYSK